MYEELSSRAQADLANLTTAASAFDLNRGCAHLPGGFAKKTKGQSEFWYYQFKNPDGKAQQIYLGSESPELLQLMRDFRGDASTQQAQRHLRSLATQAAVLGPPVLPGKHFRVIRRLSDYGFFHAGGVLIGTHAFLAYQNHFGIRWVDGNQTMDIDFAHPGKNLSIALPDGVHAKTDAAIDSLKMGFIPNVDQTTYIKSDETDLQLDFLTPRSREREAPVYIPSLSVWMQPMRFMEFSMEQTLQTILLSRSDVVVVQVPRPERFALHKLIVAGERTGEDRIKSKKDLLQSASLIGYLSEHDPQALQDAWQAVWRHGKKWASKCQAGAQALERAHPGLDLSFLEEGPEH